MKKDILLLVTAAVAPAACVSGAGPIGQVEQALVSNYYPTEPSPASGPGGLTTVDPGVNGGTPVPFVTGWTVGKTLTSGTSSMQAGVERAVSTFGGTLSNDTSGGASKCFALGNLTGEFAFNIGAHFAVMAEQQGGNQDGRLHLRLWKGAAANGSGAVEMTSGDVVCPVRTNIGQWPQDAGCDITPVQNRLLTNEYLFLCLAWEITGAGGNNASDIKIVKKGNVRSYVTLAYCEGGPCPPPPPPCEGDECPPPCEGDDCSGGGGD